MVIIRRVTPEENITIIHRETPDKMSRYLTVRRPTNINNIHSKMPEKISK